MRATCPGHPVRVGLITVTSAMKSTMSISPHCAPFSTPFTSVALTCPPREASTEYAQMLCIFLAFHVLTGLTAKRDACCSKSLRSTGFWTVWTCASTTCRRLWCLTKTRTARVAASYGHFSLLDVFGSSDTPFVCAYLKIPPGNTDNMILKVILKIFLLKLVTKQRIQIKPLLIVA
jgi:hypothetical protein